jgi:hypothetical protein
MEGGGGRRGHFCLGPFEFFRWFCSVVNSSLNLPLKKSKSRSRWLSTHHSLSRTAYVRFLSSRLSSVASSRAALGGSHRSPQLLPPPRVAFPAGDGVAGAGAGASEGRSIRANVGVELKGVKWS